MTKSKVEGQCHHPVSPEILSDLTGTDNHGLFATSNFGPLDWALMARAHVCSSGLEGVCAHSNGSYENRVWSYTLTYT